RNFSSEGLSGFLESAGYWIVSSTLFSSTRFLFTNVAENASDSPPATDKGAVKTITTFFEETNSFSDKKYSTAKDPALTQNAKEAKNRILYHRPLRGGLAAPSELVWVSS